MPAPRGEPPLAGARVPKVSLHVPGSLVAYRNQPVVEARLGFAEPFRVAETSVTPVAAEVETAGAAGVVKDTTEPNAVPAELEAMAQT